MIRKIILVSIVAMIIAFAYKLAMNMSSDKVDGQQAVESDVSNTEGTNNPMIVGTFELQDFNGMNVTEQTYLNKYVLVYFGFTNCPEICPNSMNVISDAINLLSDDKKLQLQPLFVTVDPERDNAETLKAFLSHFHPLFIGLTGTPEQVNKTMESYKVFAQKEGSEGNYNINHSTITYLMDKEGKFLGHFSYGITADQLAAELNNYIQ